MGQKNAKVEEFLRTTSKWHQEFEKMRAIILEYDVVEELKWGVPCYLYQGKNLDLIHGFKEYCAILFLQGALFQDPKHILVQQTQNVQAGRQMRFTSTTEIEDRISFIQDFLLQAMEVEKSGQKVDKKSFSESDYPAEFLQKLQENADLKKAFEALTPGRKRAYLLYFSAPKQTKTRETRIEKSIPRILAGKGIDDLL